MIPPLSTVLHEVRRRHLSSERISSLSNGWSQLLWRGFENVFDPPCREYADEVNRHFTSGRYWQAFQRKLAAMGESAKKSLRRDLELEQAGRSDLNFSNSVGEGGVQLTKGGAIDLMSLKLSPPTFLRGIVNVFCTKF